MAMTATAASSGMATISHGSKNSSTSQPLSLAAIPPDANPRFYECYAELEITPGFFSNYYLIPIRILWVRNIPVQGRAPCPGGGGGWNPPCVFLFGVASFIAGLEAVAPPTSAGARRSSLIRLKRGEIQDPLDGETREFGAEGQLRRTCRSRQGLCESPCSSDARDNRDNVKASLQSALLVIAERV